MKFNTEIAQRTPRPELHRLFIDWKNRIIAVTDGYVAAYRKLLEKDNCIEAGGIPVNLDEKQMEVVFKKVANPEARVVTMTIDAVYLKMAINQLEHKSCEWAKRQVSLEVFRTEALDGPGYIVALSQPDRAVIVASFGRDIQLDTWRPYLSEGLGGDKGKAAKC